MTPQQHRNLPEVSTRPAKSKTLIFPDVTDVIWHFGRRGIFCNDIEMGRRRQPRVQGILPVRISGTSLDGRHFSEHVCTMELSAKGTRLAGVRANLAVGDTLWIGYRHRTARFRIKWLFVASYSPREIHIGVECLEQDKKLWPIKLPVEGADRYESLQIGDVPCSSDRRRQGRFAVAGTACVSKLSGGIGTWGKVCKISLGGCYLQTSKSFNLSDRVGLLIKVAGAEIQANGIVRFSDSMSGVGIGFTYLGAAERRKLTRLIAHLEEHLITRAVFS